MLPAAPYAVSVALELPDELPEFEPFELECSCEVRTDGEEQREYTVKVVEDVTPARLRQLGQEYARNVEVANRQPEMALPWPLTNLAGTSLRRRRAILHFTPPFDIEKHGSRGIVRVTIMCSQAMPPKLRNWTLRLEWFIDAV